MIFELEKGLISEVYVVKFSLYSKLVLVISTLYRRGKLLEHFILIVVALLLNILLSWAFVRSLNCSVMCRPPWWFECCFCRSSWIHCWLLQFYRIIPVNLLLQPFFFINFGVYPGLPLLAFPLWADESVLELRHRLSQVAQLPGNGLRKHAEAEADVKRVTPNPGRVCAILNHKR